MTHIFKMYDAQNNEYPMPETDNFEEMCTVAFYISKGSERFPSATVIIKDERDYIHAVYIFGEKFIRE